MKNSLFWVIACILLIASGSAMDKAGDVPRELAILTTSDLQSQVVPFNTSPDEPLQGGLERISALAKSMRASTDGALLLSSGDDLIGAFYAFYGGEPEMRAMTLAGYDAVSPGNHEFDMGWTVYLNATKHAGFPILCANLEIQDPEFRSAIKPSAILNISGVKVGLFGLMTPDLVRLARTGEGISVNADVETIAAEQVKSLRSQGADLVIAISHMGVTLDGDLARNVSGIDLIVGGHDHIYVNTSVKGPEGWRTLIVQDGMSGECMGILRFTYSGRGRGIENPCWQTVPLNDSVGYDPVIRDYLAPFVEDYQTRLSLEIGSSAVDLDAQKKSMRSQEMPLGNLIADAWLAWFPQADMAAINGGGVRGDRIYPKGPISYLTLNTILPFGNTLVLINMTGQEVKQMLEVSAAALDPEDTGVEDGGFLQVAGIKFKIDRKAQPFAATYDGLMLKEMKSPGDRVSEVFVQRNGTWEPLDEQNEYEVLLPSWTTDGGDGYYLFAEMPAERKYDTTVKDLDPLAAYIKENSPVAPKTEGRIEISS
ncbi:MAG TPA: bifunctional UDP-sugar hydrolase/5'-nucleotidase [Methanotrichaceae archaeon]|nr:bifunctional UDP-sugar hydrolase/5'-nucleotidase [Methanotrichaceae archaeon]